MALSRLDLLAHSLATFRKLLEPVVGANVSRAFVDFRRAGRTLALPRWPACSAILRLIGKMISSVLASNMAARSPSWRWRASGSADTGVPLMEGSSAVLAPSNISALSKDLEILIRKSSCT